jgi:hypothetical protein
VGVVGVVVDIVGESVGVSGEVFGKRKDVGGGISSVVSALGASSCDGDVGIENSLM